MAARAPIVASDIDAFRQVLADGAAGELFVRGDASELARSLVRVLDDPGRREQLVAAGIRAVGPYDWALVVQAVLRVYELAIAGAGLPPGGVPRS
jgi:phosphatidylinositol alpha-mannosyltransferase